MQIIYLECRTVVELQNRRNVAYQKDRIKNEKINPKRLDFAKDNFSMKYILLQLKFFLSTIFYTSPT